MSVVVTGPEGSGTTVLSELLAACGLDVLHRSLPYAGIWWLGAGYRFDPASYEPFPEGTRFVVTRRWETATIASVVRRYLAPNEAVARHHRRAALRLLARLSGERTTYEDLLADPRGEVGRLALALGGTLPAELPEVRDENAKWVR